MRFPAQTFRLLKELLRPAKPDPAQQLFRLRAVEREVILPIKALYLAILTYYFYLTPWYGESPSAIQLTVTITKQFFAFYLIINAGVAFALLRRQRLSLEWGQRVVFVMSVFDSLFLAALTLVTTGGFSSVLYFVFMALIIRNAITFPVAAWQIALNLVVLLSYALAGTLDLALTKFDIEHMDAATRKLYELPDQIQAEPFLLRFTVLIFLAVCCYGLQVLSENARQALEEAREFAARQEQLRAAGRVAAEIAHKIKNPLAIINNAAYSLQRSLASGTALPMEQLGIIREEVSRSDRIITELMGYAQLAEGTVEKLNVTEELNRALNKVFPPGTYKSIEVSTDYADHLPPLLMQRKHLEEILVNILQNGREAMVNGGHIELKAEAEGETVRIIITDDGPGIPPEKVEKVFEAYFSTKPQGTGLGLAIARHNAEIYAGKVRVESGLGRGARFILELPTRTFMKIRQ